MNSNDALSFFVFGTLMNLLPKMFPGHFPPSTFGEASTRALWLEVMGVVQVGIAGAFFMARVALPAVTRWSSALTALRAKDRSTVILSHPGRTELS